VSLGFLPKQSDEERQFGISTCSFFAVVEDAFFTCWKGYSSARISGSDVVFEPLGSELDARLRLFRTHDGYDKDSDRIFNIDILTSPEIMNGGRFPGNGFRPC